MNGTITPLPNGDFDVNTLRTQKTGYSLYTHKEGVFYTYESRPLLKYREAMKSRIANFVKRQKDFDDVFLAGLAMSNHKKNPSK